jgi:hypothetical protein
MKRIFYLAIAGLTLAACNETTPPINQDTRDNSTVTETPPPASTTAYIPAEGDVTYRDGKLQVMRNGAWVEANDEVTLSNGAVVEQTGKIKKDGKEIKIEDGTVINKEGDFFDKAGQKIENAWDATKDGVKKAGNEIEKGAEKAGDKVDDATDNDHHDDDKK